VDSITGCHHLRRRSDIQPDEDAVSVREVSDDLAHRLGQKPDERRHRENLISGRQLRVLNQVDDLDPVSTLEMLLADPLEIGERLDRARRLPGDVQPLDLLHLDRRSRGRTRTNLRHLHNFTVPYYPYYP
jgi:hypothetical protein